MLSSPGRLLRYFVPCISFPCTVVPQYYSTFFETTKFIISKVVRESCAGNEGSPTLI